MSTAGDGVDLHPGAPGEGGNLDRGPRRRLGREMPGINLVHLRELGEVDHKDGRADDMAQRQARRFEDALHVLDHALGLGDDVAGADKLTRGGVEGDLAGEENEVAGVDGLGIRSDGLGRAVAGDDLLSHREALRADMITLKAAPGNVE